MKKFSHSQLIWFAALLILIAMLVYPQLTKKDNLLVISSFQECMDAGYSVMESYPRQCNDGNQTFIEEIEDSNHKWWMIDDQWKQEESIVFCTMDAKACPDGSYVGRVGPSCEFVPCPGE
jgi:hypothetical protein